MDPNLIKLSVSPNRLVNETRESALLLIKQFSKKILSTTKFDIDWFWKDFYGPPLDSPENPYSQEWKEWSKEYTDGYKEDTKYTKEIVRNNIETISKYYPIDIVTWTSSWYDYMPEFIDFNLFRTGKIDWDLFFSVVSPIKQWGAPSFSLFIEKLNNYQGKLESERLIQECYDNVELRTRIIDGIILPSKYTEYDGYWVISKRVHDILYKEVHKLIKETGLSPLEAIEICKKTPTTKF